MGSHRLHLRSVLVAFLVCFSSFAGEYTGDLSEIISILDDINNVADIIPDYFLSFDADLARLQELPGMASNLRSIESNTTYFRNNGLRFITNTLWSISQKLESDEQYHLTGNTSTSYESLYVHDVRSDDIYSRLGDLQASINNLTNYLCYSPEYVSSFTNRYSQIFPQSYSVSTMDNSVISQYFKFYYGYTPSSQLVSDFKNTVGRLATYDLASSIVTLVPSSALTGSPGTTLAWYNNLRGQLSAIGVNANTRSAIDAIGNARYFAYGTKRLTDTTIGISNTLANIESINLAMSNALFDASIVPSGISSSSGNSLISAVQNGVEQVENFTEEPDTNIVGEVLSGAIHAISDLDYTKEINDTQNSTPDQFHDLDGVISELNEFTAPFDDIAEDLTTYDTTQDFVMEIDYGFLGSGNHTAVITVPNFRNTHTRAGSTLDNIFTVAANILRLCMMMVFFARGYDSLSRHCYQMGYLPI